MRYAIRPYDLADVPLLFAAVRESLADLGPFMPWAHPDYAIADSEEWVESRAQERAAGTAFDFVVTHDGRFIGGCGLNAIDTPNRRANLGYWIRSSARNHGAATAAVGLLTDWAFANTDLIRLEIVVSVRNDASLRVAEKAGALREGVLRSRLLLHGEMHDAVMFSIIRGPAQT